MGCIYIWIGDQWSLVSQDCKKKGCEQPAAPGSFIGQEVGVPCRNEETSSDSCEDVDD